MLTYADVCPRMLTYAEKANQSLELRVDCAEKPLLISCANTIAKTSLFAIHTYIHTYIYRGLRRPLSPFPYVYLLSRKQERTKAKGNDIKKKSTTAIHNTFSVYLNDNTICSSLSLWYRSLSQRKEKHIVISFLLVKEELVFTHAEREDILLINLHLGKMHLLPW